MAEPQTGMRGTKFVSGTENSNVREVADRIFLLQPDAAPLVQFIQGLKGKESVDNPKYEWFEDELLPNTVEVEGAPGTGTTINVVAGTGVRVRVDDILITSSGESILVTAISTDALTVERSKGAVAAQTLADADQLILAGNAMQEGASNPPFRFTQKAAKTNFIQIFRDPVELTTTQAHTKSYGGDDRTFQRTKKAIEHKRSIEQAFLFGDAFEDTSGTQTRRGTGGVISTVTTNVDDVGITVTEQEFETWLRKLFRFHPTITAPSKLLLASPMLVSAINFWAKSALQIETSEKTFGVSIANYRSGHGTLKITNHWLLEDFTEFKKYGFGLDPMNLKYMFLNGLDTKLHTSIQNKTDEKELDEYRTHAGLRVTQERTHGIIKNFTGYAA